MDNPIPLGARRKIIAYLKAHCPENFRLDWELQDAKWYGNNKLWWQAYVETANHPKGREKKSHGRSVDGWASCSIFSTGEWCIYQKHSAGEGTGDGLLASGGGYIRPGTLRKVEPD
jgi:hypothetical protein